MIKIKGTLSEEKYSTSGENIGDPQSQEIDTELNLNLKNLIWISTDTDIFSSIREKIFDVKNEVVKGQLIKFINCFAEIYVQYCHKNNVQQNIKKLAFTEDEDGSGLLEWNFYCFRIGFSFEVNKDDSNYYFIYDDIKTKKLICESDLLQEEKYQSIINTMFEFVLLNT